MKKNKEIEWVKRIQKWEDNQWITIFEERYIGPKRTFYDRLKTLLKW
jgi:hypothetical protein